MTPTGLPQKGDRLRHTETDGLFTVVKREGNDSMYSLILRPDVPWPGMRQAYGHPGCFRLLEAGYWIGRTYEVEQ